MKILSGRFLTFFLAFILYIFSTKTALATTYYVRADGTVTAAGKASATSPNSASTSLNMAQVNAATFLASDQILFSSQGGNYTSLLTVPSGGSGVGSEITYANVTGETPIIAITTGNTLDTNAKSNIIIQGLTVNYTGLSASTNIGVFVKAGSNIQFKNMHVDMGGFGYNFYSNAITSDVLFDTVTMTNCRTANSLCISFGGSSNSGMTIQNSSLANSGQINNVATLHVTNTTITGTLTIQTGQNVTLSSLPNIKGITLTSVTTGIISNVIGSAGTGFIFSDSSGIAVSDTSMTGSTNYGAFDVAGSSHDISFDRVTANNNSKNGFVARNTSYAITYHNCTADTNNNIGFLAGDSAHDIQYWYSEASYNGTIDVVFDGAGFLPHNTVTNVKCYYCIAHHNYTTGIGDVSTGNNLFYNKPRRYLTPVRRVVNAFGRVS